MEKTHELLALKKRPTQLSQGPNQSRVGFRCWNKRTFSEEKADSIVPWIPLKWSRLLVLPQRGFPAHKADLDVALSDQKSTHLLVLFPFVYCFILP